MTKLISGWDSKIKVRAFMVTFIFIQMFWWYVHHSALQYTETIYIAFLTVTIEIGEDILANVGAVGFYRVNYDAGMWQTLIGKLASAQFKVCILRADT